MTGNAKRLWKEGRVDLIAEAISFIQQNGLAAGVSAHWREILKAVEAMKIQLDFYYLRTLNPVGYESERP